MSYLVFFDILKNFGVSILDDMLIFLILLVRGINFQHFPKIVFIFIVVFLIWSFIDVYRFQTFSIIGTSLIAIKYLAPFVLVNEARRGSLNMKRLMLFGWLCIYVSIMMYIFLILFSVDLMTYLTPDRAWTENSSKAGRFTGLYRNVPEFGAFAISFYLVANFYYANRPSKMMYVVHPLVFTLLILADSKIYLLVYVLLFYYLSAKKIKYVLIISCIPMIIIFYENIGVVQRIIYYISRFDLNGVDPRQLDIRLAAIFTSIQIVLNEGLGLGLGRWGSFSANFFDLPSTIGYPMITLTDGLLWHYFGELGIITFIFLWIIYRYSSLPWFLFLILCCPLLSTMAFHDPGYCGLFFIAVNVHRFQHDYITKFNH